MAKTTVSYLAKADIEKAILSIRNRGKRLDEDIQHVGLSCLYHIEQHGDITLLVSLFNALPASSRGNAFIEWAVSFGRVLYVTKGMDYLGKDEEGKVGMVKAAEAGFVFDRNKDCEVDLEKADLPENKWWMYAAEKPYKPFSLQAALLVQLKTAKAKLAKADERDKVTSDEVNILTRALIDMGATIPVDKAA